MRDFRDAKAMARALRTALAANGHKITVGESLELIAGAFGVADWNTLSAAIKAAEVKPEPPPAAPPAREPVGIPEGPVWRSPSQRQTRGPYFSTELQGTLSQALRLAAVRKHDASTSEHLLLALIDDEDASHVMQACDVDLTALRQVVAAHVDALPEAPIADGENPTPTATFQRVMQRAVIHVTSAGRPNMTGANVLVALFSERETHAARFMQMHGLNRFDAVNFIAHGVRKIGGQRIIGRDSRPPSGPA